MYWRRFNLTGEPFSLTPDPAFLYLSSMHSEAYAALTMGLRERRGLISMIGEVGTGKTTLVYSLLSNLGPEIHTAYVSNARLSFDGILRSALRDFGVASDELHGAQLLDAFNAFLHRCARNGTTAALVIDEAQNLSHDTFEDLRLLSNFETYKTKLLQIVLVGQPELDTKLRDPALRQVAERIAVRCHVNPLTPQETRRYIEHRLSAVGGSIDIFSEPAIRTVISRSVGIPRAVNILCHNAMLFAYGHAKDKIARSMVLEAVNEKDGAGLVRLGPKSAGAGVSTLRRIASETPAWTWNAVFLILAVGASAAMIRMAGNIRFAAPELQAPVLTAAPLPAQQPPARPDVREPRRRPAAHQPHARLEAPAELAQAPDESAPSASVADVVEQPPLVEHLAADAAVIGFEPEGTETTTVGEPREETRPIFVVEADLPTPAAEAIEDPTDEPVATTAPPEPASERAENTAQPVAALQIAGAPIERPGTQQPVTTNGDTTLALLDTGVAGPTEPHYQIIDVAPGNSLSDLMIAIYGHYTNSLVERVQALNPQITDPDVILAGDALRFPSDRSSASPAGEVLGP